MSRRDKQFKLRIAIDELIKFGASFIDERDYAHTVLVTRSDFSGVP